MTKDSARKEAYRRDIIARTKMARELRNFKQHKVAKTLGISLEMYKSYENRTPLPHYLIEPWTMIMGVSIEWLITGEEVQRVIPMARKIVSG